MRTRTVVAVALLLLGVLTAFSMLPPSAARTDAPASTFSAERAIALLGPQAAGPHPAGSAAAAALRAHLLDELRGLGLASTTDTRVAGRARSGLVHVAGTVTDVHARIPGSAPTGRILLVAHYDSVAAGPGIADDGANVAAILEIARALRAGPPLRDDIEILLTDGEEAGLLGAQAYVDRGGAGDLTRTVVLNLEARGTSGPAIMFQAVGANAGLLPAAAAGGALATSVSDDVYKLLPNDTDLTVFGRAGLRGLNFAFVGGSANYHTSHDDLAHLDPASVQDMGASVLAATRELGDRDLGALPGGDDTYVTVLGAFLRYPVWLVVPLAALAALAVAAAIGTQRRRGARPGRIAAAAAAFLLPLLVAALLGTGLWMLLQALRPEYGLFDSGDTYRSPCYAAGSSLLAAVVLVTWYRWTRRWASAVEVALATLAWSAVLGLVAAFLSPGGAYLFTWPALVGGAALLAAARWAGRDGSRQAATGAVPAVLDAPGRAGGPDSPGQALAAAAGAVPAVLLGLPVVLLLFPLVGIALAVAPLVVLVLFGATALALLPSPSRPLSAVQAVATVAALALVGAGLAVDGFDAAHPRPVSLGYALDGASGQAWWVTDGPPAEPVVAPLLTAPASFPASRFPNLPPGGLLAGAARTAPSVVVPTLEKLDERPRADGSRDVRVRVHAGPAAYRVSVWADGVLGATVGGVPLPGGVNVGGRWGVAYAAPPAGGVELTVTARGPLVLTVVATSSGLPADAGAPALPPGASWVDQSPLAGQTSAARDFPV